MRINMPTISDICDVVPASLVYYTVIMLQDMVTRQEIKPFATIAVLNQVFVLLHVAALCVL